VLASFRLAPYPWFQLGGSIFTKPRDFSPYKNNNPGRNYGNTSYASGDTANADRLGSAPMARFVLGPFSITGEAISYGYTRQSSYYVLTKDGEGNVVDSTRHESWKKYAMQGADVLSVLSVLSRKVELFGRYSVWQEQEMYRGSMVENKDGSHVRYGAGFNYSILGQTGGNHPALALQFAWIHEQSQRETSPGVKADPTDTFIAQVRVGLGYVLSLR
jgi:hypothetical protein